MSLSDQRPPRKVRAEVRQPENAAPEGLTVWPLLGSLCSRLRTLTGATRLLPLSESSLTGRPFCPNRPQKDRAAQNSTEKRSDRDSNAGSADLRSAALPLGHQTVFMRGVEAGAIWSFIKGE